MLVHENVQILNSGLCINPSFPYIGASPDAIMLCDCCGKRAVEIKCPFCKKNEDLIVASEDKKFYLKKDSNGDLKLDHNHAYYFQVQTQLGVCSLDSAYFVVWTEEDLHQEEITFDEKFWAEITQKSDHVFVSAILPELVGRFYSRLPNVEPKQTDPVENKSIERKEVWCYCRQGEAGNMIGCDNIDCQIEWFHNSCVGVACPPRGKWFCPDCRKLPQFKPKRRKIEK